MLFGSTCCILDTMIKMNSQSAMFQFPSQPQNIAKVEALVQGLARQYNLSTDVYDNILLSLTEAVNNAIIHGNGCDCNKVVRIRTKKRKGTLAIQVSDQGCGFDINQIPDPTAPENITKPGGRGVFIMHHLCDCVKFEDGGSTVEMQFNI